MKRSLLAIVALAAPILLMMLVWQLSDTSSDAVSVSPPPPAVKVHAPVDGEATSRPATTVSPTETKPIAVQPVVVEHDFRVAKALDAWLSELAEQVENDTSYQTALAAKLLMERRFPEAVRAFDRLLVKAPDDPEVMLGKALALSADGRYEDALPLFDRLIERHGDNPTLVFNVAGAQMRAGQLGDAVANLQRTIALQPEHPKARYNLAAIYQSRGAFLDSLALWRELTTTNVAFDRKMDAWFHRGECALTLQLNLEAIECFTQVVAHHDVDAKAWCNLGIAEASLGHQVEAVTALQRALELNEQLVPALNQLAYVHAEAFRETRTADDRNAVIRYAKKSLDIAPNQPQIAGLRDAMLQVPHTIPLVETHPENE